MEIRKHSSASDLRAIKELQAENLKEVLTSDERAAEGFVTCSYDIKMLGDMCGSWSHMLAWDESKLAGYTLCMLKTALVDFPVLEPMHQKFKELDWKGTVMTAIDFVVVGQICVAKGYRKQGLLQKMYTAMREQLKQTFDLLVTEIDAENIPSLRAHKKFGFEEIVRYKEQNGRMWVIVGVDL